MYAEAAEMVGMDRADARDRRFRSDGDCAAANHNFKKDHIYAGPGGPEIAIVTPAPGDTIAPTAPTSLSAGTVTATSVALWWSGSTDTGGSGLAGYKVYRQRGSGANLPVGTVAAPATQQTPFIDQPLQPSTSYTYTVVAFDKDQNHSTASNSVTVTTSAGSTDNQAPTAPLQLTGRALTSSSVQLNWLAASDAGGSALSGYQVKRGGTTVTTVGPTVLSYQDTNLASSSSYTYTIVAVDGVSLTSPASNSVTVTTPLDTTPPSAPATVSTTTLSDVAVRVTWSAATDAGGSGLAGIACTETIA